MESEIWAGIMFGVFVVVAIVIFVIIMKYISDMDRELGELIRSQDPSVKYPMNCPKCGERMVNLENASKIVFNESKRPQWDNVYVCHTCKIKKTCRIYGKGHKNDYYINLYQENSD